MQGFPGARFFHACIITPPDHHYLGSPEQKLSWTAGTSWQHGVPTKTFHGVNVNIIAAGKTSSGIATSVTARWDAGASGVTAKATWGHREGVVRDQVTAVP